MPWFPHPHRPLAGRASPDNRVSAAVPLVALLSILAALWMTAGDAHAQGGPAHSTLELGGNVLGPDRCASIDRRGAAHARPSRSPSERGSRDHTSISRSRSS
jgi:hypothetical protein